MRLMLLCVLMMMAALCLVPPAVSAENAQPTLEEKFRVMDRDNDGRLTVKEFPYAEIFKRLDKNVDGFVTLFEMKQGMGTPEERREQETIGNTPEQKFRNLDRDRDGRLSPQELNDPGLFARMDANHDGFISQAEMLAYTKQGGTPGGAQDTSLEQKFRMADANGDGKLSPQEFNNPAYFAQMDKNHDGFVTLAELRGGTTPGDNTEKGELTLEQRFKQADKDGNGKLSPAEVGSEEFFKKNDKDGDGFLSFAELKAGFAEQNTTGEKKPLTPEQEFKQADTDGDGKLSPAEFPKPELFKQMDTNADGFVSWDEAKAHLAKTAGTAAEMNAEKRLKLYDRNGDGKLGPDELLSPETFKRLDTNGDGFVSLDELRALDKKPDEGKGVTGEAALEQHFKLADKDGDGRLSPAEYPNPEQFAKLDTNKDGFISLAEVIAAAQEKPKPPAPPTKGTTIGILTAKGEHWIEVKAKDGTARYFPLWRAATAAAPAGPDQAMLKTLKELRLANLVEVIWELQEERRRIVTVRLLAPAAQDGTVTGVVTAKTQEWIEVTPADGPAERYTPRWIAGAEQGGNLEKAIMQAIAAAQVGDTVQITWKYDERKRIISLKFVMTEPVK